MICARATRILNRGKRGHAVVQHDAFLQSLQHLVIHLAENTNGIFPLNFPGRVHQAVRQFTIGGHQQQAGSIEVQSPDADPATVFYPR